jgi:hypothetical protein
MRAAARPTTGSPRVRLPGGFAGYQLIRLSIGGAACGLFGLGLRLWELSESQPAFWGVTRAVLIMAFGFGLLAMMFWLWIKSD